MASFAGEGEAMTPDKISDGAMLYNCDVFDGLAQIEAESVQCVVTSPPYWGLRDYGTADWEGGAEECDHATPLMGGNWSADGQYRDVCRKCGARRIDSQIGLERTPDEFVAKMVEVFQAVRRVLKKTGVVFLNLGDTYAQSGGKRADEGEQRKAIERAKTKGYDVGGWGASQRATLAMDRGANTAVAGLKPKDLIGIPWRVALALQADGWWLRSDIIWHKPNPMPEAVTDRPTSAHEHVFLLAKSAKYFYDADAIREKTGDEPTWDEYEKADGHGMPSGDIRSGVNVGFGGKRDSFTHPSGRNKRNVWTLSTEGFPGAHFATFPTKLVEPCVLAGTSERGQCQKCRKSWMRTTECERVPTRPGRNNVNDPTGMANRDTKRHVTTTTTLGWQPTCKCGLDPVPDVVLDPFAGSGTVMAVAVKHGRHTIGIELSADYCGLIRKRVGAALDAWGLFG